MPKFKPGVSGNPAGRKPGTKSHVSRELEKIMRAGGGKTARSIAEKLTELTLAGNMQAAKLLLERLEGKVLSAEEVAKRQGAMAEAQMAPEQRRAKLVALLQQPELRALIEEVVKPASERIQ